MVSQMNTISYVVNLSTEGGRGQISSKSWKFLQILNCLRPAPRTGSKSNSSGKISCHRVNLYIFGWEMNLRYFHVRHVTKNRIKFSSTVCVLTTSRRVHRLPLGIPSLNINISCLEYWAWTYQIWNYAFWHLIFWNKN